MEKSVEEINVDLRRGMSVKVFQKIIEGKKERILAYQGKIIKSRGEGDSKMVTVRQFIDGVDVDRIIPIKSPSIIKIENITEKKKKTRKKAVKKVAKVSKATKAKIKTVKKA